MAEQQKPATGYPAASSQYPAGYPPPQSYAPASNGYPPSGYPPSYYPPPPPPHPNQAYYYGESGGYRASRFFRLLIIATIAIFLIVGAFFFIIWLIFRPQTPGFSVNAVTVRQFNVSGGQLTANWDVTFAVDNRDKRMAVSYGGIQALVLYNEAKLADTPLSPFQLEKKSNTTLTAKFAAVSAFVSDSGKLASERSAGQVHFRFRVLSVVQFQDDGWRMRWRSLDVRCYDVEVDFPRTTTNGTEGTLKSPSGCSVYM
ncbi:uncharacterized protein LOC116267267 [Nymphaea colorata]|uniref:uncharacterized protein LOC116267267 n=1 Tax=Nymphaea colorata TaxID=210225 RepID=UPI00129E3FD3|nr:uncharacterized protein LOC116267267 [Nymphaea colorata]